MRPALLPNKTVGLIPVALLMAACAASPAPSPQPPKIGGGPFVCKADRFDALIGQPATQALAASILQATGAGTLRWVQPGMAVTMDFRPDRVTVALDGENRTTRITCG